jgi:predicted GTPase
LQGTLWTKDVLQCICVTHAWESGVQDTTQLATRVQGQARINFGHAVLLLVDATDAHARVSAARFGVGSTLSRRELSLTGYVLEEGRLLIICLNKADALDAPSRAEVLDALNHQACTQTLTILLFLTLNELYFSFSLR